MSLSWYLHSEIAKPTGRWNIPARCKNITLRNICSLDNWKKAEFREVQQSRYKKAFTQEPEFQSSPFYYFAPPTSSQVVCAFVSMIYPPTATVVHSSVLQMLYTLLSNRDT